MSRIGDSSDPTHGPGSVPPYGGRARPTLHVVVDRTYGPYFAGKLLSAIGIWFTNVVSAIFVYQLTGSATMVAAVSIAQFVPQILLAPWAGVLGDRVDRRLVLIVCQAVTTGALLALTIFISTVGVDRIGSGAPVIVTMLVVGVALAVSNPAMLALTPSLVPPADLGTAVALTSTTASIARVVGPVIGALLYATSGPAIAYGMATVGHGFFLLVLFWITVPRSRAVSDRSAWAGFSFIRRSRELWVLLLGAGIIGFTADPVITLTPVLAEELGESEVVVGVFGSAFGVGAVLSIVVFGWLRRHGGMGTVSFVGFLLMAVGYLAVLPVVSTRVSVVGLVLAGAGFMLATSSLSTRVHRRSPDELRGRIMAVWGIAFHGMRPVAAVINGLLADYASLQIAFGLAVVLSAGAGFAIRVLVRDQATPAGGNDGRDHDRQDGNQDGHQDDGDNRIEQPERPLDP